MKLLFVAIALIIFSTYSFFNLGYFLDVTEEPTTTDLIICLGGGDYKKRVEKTLELYEKNYLKSNTIIFTGTKELKNIKEKFNGRINVIFEPKLTNTAEEVKYIKEYMIEHSLSSALIVADPPQSRRISILKEVFGLKNDENLSFKIISNDSKIWDSKYYYKNDNTRRYAFSEVVKIIYNLFIYKLIDSIGLLDTYYIHFYDYVKKYKGLVQ
jgi:uncharacterized SAM-binding protein YcdF (DUF218 family)